MTTYSERGQHPETTEPVRPDLRDLTAEQITELADDIADAVAEAIASIGVAYSHATTADFRTINRRWSVHDMGGNPFEKDEWHGRFTDEDAAKNLAQDMRRDRARERVRMLLTAALTKDVAAPTPQVQP